MTDRLGYVLTPEREALIRAMDGYTPSSDTYKELKHLSRRWLATLPTPK